MLLLGKYVQLPLRPHHHWVMGLHNSQHTSSLGLAHPPPLPYV